MKEAILFIESLTARDAIAFYAAIISTITLVWNIINLIIEKLPRIKVKIGVYNRLTIPDFERINSIVSITIVNKSIFDMYIKQPFIKLPERINNHNRYTVSNPYRPINYPVLIRPREQYTEEFELGVNLVNLLRRCNNPNKKVRIEITDTTGKTFKSNKIKISTVIQLAVNGQNENS